MKFVSLMLIACAFGCAFVLPSGEAAAIVTCGDDASPSAAGKQAGNATAESGSDVQQFFRTVHCSLEKARPVVEQIEKEVKSLRSVAQRLGEDVFARLGGFFDRLFVSTRRRVTAITSSTNSHTKNNCNETATNTAVHNDNDNSNANDNDDIIPDFASTASGAVETRLSSTTDRAEAVAVDKIATTAPAAEHQGSQGTASKVPAAPPTDEEDIGLNEI